MHLPEDFESSPQINIVPMIDVVFVVLTFFILSSLFLTRSEGLPVDLPSAETGEAALESHTLTLTRTLDGKLLLGNEPVNLDTLPERVRARKIGDRALLIIIQADEAVPHGEVVSIMDRLRTLENIQIAIATQPSSVISQP